MEWHTTCIRWNWVQLIPIVIYLFIIPAMTFHHFGWLKGFKQADEIDRRFK